MGSNQILGRIQVSDHNITQSPLAFFYANRVALLLGIFCHIGNKVCFLLFCFSDWKLCQNIHGFLNHFYLSPDIKTELHAQPRKNKKPPVLTDRGRRNAVPPHVRTFLTECPSQRLTTLSAVSGEPVLPYCFFQASRSGRYFSVLSCCLAPSGSSLVDSGCLLHPIHAFYEVR